MTGIGPLPGPDLRELIREKHWDELRGAVVVLRGTLL
jgi:hypothetical protein